MKKVNYHTHTYRCKHASGSDEEYVIAAIKNGYTELGFSDHCPWKYDSNFVAGMRMNLDEFIDYKKSILSLKEKYKDQISIKFGLEVEYFSKYMDWMKQFLIDNDIDYIIFGNHYFKTDELRNYYGTSCEDDAMLNEYVLSCIEGMKTNMYSYLCHPDLFMRANRRFDEMAIEASHKICKASKQYNIPLEYNLAGAMINDQYGFMKYPHDEFWKIAGSYSCSAIIGVDAHSPDTLETDLYRNEGIRKLEAFGLKIIDEIEFKKWEK